MDPAGVQYHILRLDAPRTPSTTPLAPWNVSIRPAGPARTWAQVLTGIVNFHLSMHSDVCFSTRTSYSGEYIQRTGSGLSPDFLFAQYTFRY